MANANQFKASWDAFDKIFDEAFSSTKKAANRPPYFSPTPFTPFPPTDYDYDSAITPYPRDLGGNIGHDEVEEQGLSAHTRGYHEESDRDDSYGFHYDDVYSRADMDYYEDDDYEKELWTKRARKAQAVGQGNSGVQKTDALKLTGVTATGFGSGTVGANAMGLNIGSSAFPQRPQSSTLPQTVSQPRPTINTNVPPIISNTSVNPSVGNNNNNNAGTASTSNPLSNAMNAFSAAAATLNGLTNTLNNLGLGLSANSTNINAHSNSLATSSAPPRAAAPIVSQVPTLAQPRPPIRKPPPPLNLDESSSGSGSASSSSLDPTSPFKLSPGPSPPAPSAPPAAVRYQPEFYPQHQQDPFQFQQYRFQLDSEIPTSRSMFLQQQQQVQASQQKSQTLAGQKQGKMQEAILTQVRSQTQPIPVPTISKASTQAAIQESRGRSFERSTGAVPLASPSPKSKAAGILSTSLNSDPVDYDNAKSPTPSTSSVHKKRRPNPGKVTFRNSPDGTRTTAMFDMQGIKKSDVHVSYQNDKVVVSWESVTVEDKIEDGKIVRERREKKFVRTLPLPEGTKFDQVKASMDGRHLNLTYPKFRS